MPAPRPYRGLNTNVRFAAEASWGTAIASGSLTHAMRVSSWSLQRTVTKSRRNLLTGSSGSMNSAAHFIASDMSGGSVATLLSYQGMGLLLRELLLGTPATTGPTDGLYSHAFALGANNPTGLTFEGNRGSGTAETFSGCVLNKGVLEAKAGDEVKLTLDVIARTAAARTTKGTPTYSNSLYVSHQHVGTFGFGGRAYYPLGLKLTVDNKFSTRQLLGSAETAAPARSQMMEVTLELDLEWAEDDLYTAFLADTQGNGSVTFTHPSNGMSITILGHNLYVEACTDPITSAGIVSQSVTFKAESDGTNEGLLITVVNDQSSAVAA